VGNKVNHKGKNRKKNTKKEETDVSGRPCARRSCLITTSELLAFLDGTEDSVLHLTTLTPTLPPSFFKLFKTLRTLDLKSVGLTFLPPQIIELQNLQRLDLRYNSLTYLPSQIAQLPNLHQLRMYDDRDRKTRLLKGYSTETTQRDDSQDRRNGWTTPVADKINLPGRLCDSPEEKLENDRTNQRMPTLFQICARMILSSLPATKSEDPEALSWEDLEPLYQTGKFEERDSDILHSLPFPSHFLPPTIALELCSLCSEIVIPIHTEIFRVQDVALCRVTLRYVFCSHKCSTEMIRRWEDERRKEEDRKRLRQQRFEAKNSSSEANQSNTA
jgi:hypothetical protein